MTVYLLALLVGLVAGLRAMTAPEMAGWAAHLGWLDLSGTWLALSDRVCRVAQLVKNLPEREDEGDTKEISLNQL